MTLISFFDFRQKFFHINPEEMSHKEVMIYVFIDKMKESAIDKNISVLCIL